MKSPLRRIHRGLTLIELSIAIMMGMATGSMLLVLFNQQLTFLDIYKRQNFLTEEAPIVSMHVSRLIGKANRFSLHATRDDALNNRNPFQQNTTMTAVRLVFRAPDGNQMVTVLAFDGATRALEYYTRPPDLGLKWVVTRAPRTVTFAMDEGVMLMTLTGTHDEQITYAGTMQQ